MNDLTADWPGLVEPFVRNLRPRPSPLDIEVISGRLEIRLFTHRFDGPTRAAALAGETIVLDERLRPREARAAFAHEVGHLLIQRGLLCIPRDCEELFCDWFARELALPAAWLGVAVSASRLMRQLRVTPEIVATQLARAGMAPAIQRLDRTVLCVICGAIAHGSACACSAWRNAPPERRKMLPDVREHNAWSGHAIPMWVQEALVIPLNPPLT